MVAGRPVDTGTVIRWLREEFVCEAPLSQSTFAERYPALGSVSSLSRFERNQRTAHQTKLEYLAVQVGFASWMALLEEYEQRKLGDADQIALVPWESLFRDSQAVHLRLMKGAEYVRDTRIGIVSYPNPGYRNEFNKALQNLIIGGAIVRRIEGFYSFARLAEIEWNLEFHKSRIDRYRVSALPQLDSERWYPTFNCTIYDDDRGMLGGIHRDDVPSEEPFFELRGRRAVRLMVEYWDRLFEASQPLVRGERLPGQIEAIARSLDPENWEQEMKIARTNLHRTFREQPGWLPRP